MDIVEMNAIGTSLGDYLEYMTMRSVFSPSAPTRATPLLLGTHARVTRHCVHASGMVALAKAILSLQRRTMSPNLLDYELASDLPVREFGAALLGEAVELSSSKWPLVALVHGFAQVGSVADVVLLSEAGDGADETEEDDSSASPTASRAGTRPSSLTPTAARRAGKRQRVASPKPRRADGPPPLTRAELTALVEDATGRRWEAEESAPDEEFWALRVSSLGLTSVEMMKIRNLFQEQRGAYVTASSMFQLDDDKTVADLRDLLHQSPTACSPPMFSEQPGARGKRSSIRSSSLVLDGSPPISPDRPRKTSAGTTSTSTPKFFSSSFGGGSPAKPPPAARASTSSSGMSPRPPGLAEGSSGSPRAKADSPALQSFQLQIADEDRTERVHSKNSGGSVISMLRGKK